MSGFSLDVFEVSNAKFAEFAAAARPATGSEFILTLPCIFSIENH
jgi:hypothetical protein